jgi:hypothetical protein
MKFIALLAFIISLTSISSKKLSTKKKSKERSSAKMKTEEKTRQFGPQAQMSNVVGPSALTYGYGTSDNTLANFVVSYIY